MTSRPVIIRAEARRDAEDALAHHRAEAGDEVAFGFISALHQAYALIGRHPASGSTRYAAELGLPGLHSLPLRQFPYVLFCFERDDAIDVWRILHGRRDIQGHMREPPR